jgi:hypothetical protein
MRSFLGVSFAMMLAGMAAGCNSKLACNTTDYGGFPVCLEYSGPSCPSGFTSVSSCAAGDQIGSCYGSEYGYSGTALIYSAAGRTTADAETLCTADLGGTWTGPSGSSPDAWSSSALGCDVKVGTQEICTTSSVLNGTELCAAISGVPTTVVNTCPAANTVGTCTLSEDGGTVTEIYYSPGYTAATAQTQCANFPGTWTPN